MNRSDGGPDFPLTIVWPDGERETWEDEDHLAMNLEWFDSEATGREGKARVFDRLGRSVRLRITALAVDWCELDEGGGDRVGS
jgi:hypothetical protein